MAVTVNADTSMRIVETITYDFESEYRHGIFRDIPVYDETLTGLRREYGVTVADVTMDGAPVPWVTSDNGPFLNVKIGDPNTTITGPHTYVITYTVTDGLRVITADDAADPAMPQTVSAGDVELFWDLIGTGWDVGISSAKATVTGPGTALSAVCYVGPAGSDTRCPSATVQSIALLGPATLAAGEAMTTAVVYPASAFTSTPNGEPEPGAAVQPARRASSAPSSPPDCWPRCRSASPCRGDGRTPVPRCRVPRRSTRRRTTSARPSSRPPGRDGPGTVDARVLVATLLDLAERRWINVSTDAAGHLTVDWVGTGTTPLRPWEESLLGVILQGGSTATLASYDKAMATLWGSLGASARRRAGGSRSAQPAR